MEIKEIFDKSKELIDKNLNVKGWVRFNRTSKK